MALFVIDTCSDIENQYTGIGNSFIERFRVDVAYRSLRGIHTQGLTHRGAGYEFAAAFSPTIEAAIQHRHIGKSHAPIPIRRHHRARLVITDESDLRTAHGNEVVRTLHRLAARNV